MSSNKQRRRDEEDGLLDDDEEGDYAASKKQQRPKKRKKTDRGGGLIDDAAELSGEDDDDEEDEEDDENNNDYVKDGFVVDEEEDEDEDVETRKKKDDLDDSDDDDDDEDDDDERVKRGDGQKSSRNRLMKVRRMKPTLRLDEEDLVLIQDAQADKAPKRGAEPVERERLVAKTEAELRKSLFHDSEDEDELQKTQQQRKPVRVERYDEDGMDDFIDDDIGDQGHIMASERRGGIYDEDTNEVNEAQLNEASEIFGTDYLDFMGEDEQPDEYEEELLGKKYRERGVGIDYGLDSDEDIISDDDDDLFGDDDEEAGMSSQKAEALRLKREKRKLARAERRRQATMKKTEKRKAQLRRAFEPVQLVENFFTERDDEIRLVDAPERFYDWKVPFHGSDTDGINADEEAEASWIASRIPDIAAEVSAVSTAVDADDKLKLIHLSIANALRFMHRDKLEPAFIKRYRKDDVSSPAVRENLYQIMEEDGEWDQILNARKKVESLLISITKASEVDESSDADAQKLVKLKAELIEAQEKLDETANQESIVKTELEAFGAVDDNDDEDDNLFGDEGDKDGEKKKERIRLTSHLATLQSLMEARGEKVSQLQTQMQVTEARNKALNDPAPAQRVTKKTNRNALWDTEDYLQYTETLTDTRQVLDLHVYLNLIKEGNDAVRQKEMPLLELRDGKKEKRKRSRRFDRDFYRTSVSDGLRAVCYKFLLPPIRVGIKLDDLLTFGKFDFQRRLPGESVDEPGNPLKWAAPTIPTSTPTEFANELVGSGELVLRSTTGGELSADSMEINDPLRGCRYVAAMELAHEPRVRRHLRDIYRRHALLTTKPTKKGLDEIDAFHDHYGLHLIRNKPTKDHFSMDNKESDIRKLHMSDAERIELDTEMRKKQRDSCLQYLNILKAEQFGNITVHVHLPLLEQSSDWYKIKNDQLFLRKAQNMSPLLNELEKVYLPYDGDSDEWNQERHKVLEMALINFLLPQFESELRRDLRDVATDQGVAIAAENLREAAMQGPYRPTAMLFTESRFLHPTGDLPLVGVCCVADGKDATYLASVTSRGESGENLAIPSGTRIDNQKMREKVINFLFAVRPAAVIVGTSGGFESRMFQRKMNEIVKDAVDRWKKRDIQGDDEDDEAFETRRNMFKQLQPASHFDDDEEEDWSCNVELVDDSVAQLFGRSVRGKKEFPDHSVNLKCAIAVARYAQDPLAEYTYAWGVASDAGVFGAEMLYLDVHPMQQLMPKPLLLRQYERTLCEIVADIGVDLNIATSHNHLKGLLMFVPGLGPRKAANIKQIMNQSGGAIARRRDLLEKRMLGPVVYNNSVAFLRISQVDQLADQFLHPLDETRLHPDVYLRNNWAVKIAFDALEREDSKTQTSAATKALRDVMENSHREVERLYRATKDEWEKHYGGNTFNSKDWDPRKDVPSDLWRDKVEELDLNAFANMIEENGHGKWHSHLEMIKWEFRLPFADPRKPMETLAGDKLFRLITGETDQSLRPGKEITGKVVRNGDFGTRVKLEGDIPAFIPLRNLSDEHVESADDFVHAGQVITAVVTEVKKDHMTVDMSLRMEDFRKSPSVWERPQSLPLIDDYFDVTASKQIEAEFAKKREAHIEALQANLGTKTEGDDTEPGAVRKKRIGRVVRRACIHPAFRNAKNEEVDRELKAGGRQMVGEALIRPSSKSSDSLAIHWHFSEGKTKVIEVVEEDKETEASIGKKLKIKDEEYTSIDELLGRFIAPMNDYVEELMNHRKFMDLLEEEVDEKLMDMKKQTPKAIPYSLCWLEAYPGFASLRFVGSVTPRHHTISITPNGFVWGNNTYTNLDRLINDFKKNPRGTAKPKLAVPSKPPAPSAASKGRWAAKPAPPPPPAAPRPSAWSQNKPPPPPPPPAPPLQVAVQASSWAQVMPRTDVWGQQTIHPQPPLPQQFPPAYSRPPPPTQPLPPPLPADLPPPSQELLTQSYAQPPPPPPPAFDIQAGGPASQGRGRGRTLPAWLSKS